MEKIFEKLENSFLFDKKHNVILGIIEAISAVLSGAFIHSLVSHFNVLDFVFSITFTLLFSYLLYRSLTKQQNFSISGLGELKSTIELDRARKDLERKILIDDYIDNAIKSLNLNTCNYNEINVDDHLCEQSLEIGLRSVCQPYFDNPQNLLNTHKAKFTVGAYVNWFQKLPSTLGTQIVAPVEDHDIFIPRDDFNFREHIPKEILTDSTLIDLSFIFQVQFLDSFRHSKFVHTPFSFNEKKYSIITSPIPTVCEDGALGVLFVICEQLDAMPGDLENVTHIFCRLFSNWLSRYNECVSGRCDRANIAFQKEPMVVVSIDESLSKN